MFVPSLNAGGFSVVLVFFLVGYPKPFEKQDGYTF